MHRIEVIKRQHLKSSQQLIEVIIDELTPCLVHRESGEHYKTTYKPFSYSDLKNLTKKKGWKKFDWKQELSTPTRRVFKLMVIGSDEIQGLISFEIAEGYIYVFLVENASWNIGSSTQIFKGVGAHLFAIACKFSFELGFEGVVAFTSKTNLIDHYQKNLGAERLGGHNMAIGSAAAKHLVDKYFEEGTHNGRY